jgi:hypothetical protein
MAARSPAGSLIRPVSPLTLLALFLIGSFSLGGFSQCLAAPLKTQRLTTLRPTPSLIQGEEAKACYPPD